MRCSQRHGRAVVDEAHVRDDAEVDGSTASICRRRRVWNYGRATQVATFLSLLKPEYQERMCASCTTRAWTPRTSGRRRTVGRKGSCGNGTGPKPQRFIVTPDVLVFMAAAAAICGASCI